MSLKLKSNRAKSEYARLKNLELNYFDAPGKDNLIRRYAKNVGQGKAKSGAYDSIIKQGGATKNPITRRAGLTVAADIDPQLTESANYRSGVGQLYKQLAATQSANQANAANSYGTARDNTTNNFDNLASTIAGSFNASKDNSMSEQQRLGIRGAYDQSQSEQSLLQGLGESGKANALTNLDSSKQGFDQLAALLQSEGAQSSAQYQNAALQNEAALKGSRRGKVATLKYSLQDQARAQAAEQAQQDFLNSISGGRYNLDLQKFGLSKKNAKLARKAKKVAMIKDLTQAQKNKHDAAKPYDQ